MQQQTQHDAQLTSSSSSSPFLRFLLALGLEELLGPALEVVLALAELPSSTCKH